MKTVAEKEFNFMEWHTMVFHSRTASIKGFLF
jgi:hypothetical protein